MADKESRESIVETKVTDGVSESSIRMTSKEITLKVDVDVSDAITGLKAVQREAKKATQELNAMSANGFSIRANGGITICNECDTSEIFYTTKVLRNFTTEQLEEELNGRPGYTQLKGVSINGKVKTWDELVAEVDADIFSRMPTEKLAEELARRDGIYTSEFIAGTKFEFSGPGQIIVIEK